ncbi:MAG: hypothetical protein J1E43_05855 [Christensenellaceae bacterium]|nr:hypothetical protein [Christensenellaceae bacterium]
MKIAAIGIGSNSVRMLVALVEDGRAIRVRRDRAGTRLFAGLDENRNLSQQAMDATIAVVRDMAVSAREEGAQEVRLFATSATRDAANRAEFARLLQERAGLELEICSGKEEATLSFLGATGGGFCGVVDIGGGSTEIVVGEEHSIRCAFSCQMGAVRLASRLPINSHSDLQAVIDLADSILEHKLHEHPTLTLPERWTGTGGTFTTLGAMLLGVHWTDRTYMHGTVLPLEEIERRAWQLADMSLEERRQIPGLQPNRVDIIVHGICILLAVMRRLNIREITVSEMGNLDGYIRDRYHARW